MKLYIQKVDLQIQNNGFFTLHTRKSEHECKKGTFLFDPLFLYLWEHNTALLSWQNVDIYPWRN